MSTSSIPDNPYRPMRSDPRYAPFVGRQKAFEFLYQQLTRSRSSVLLGRYDGGKTAVLRHFQDYFDQTFVPVYLPLRGMPLQGEGEWLLALAEATLSTMLEHNLSLSRVVTLQPDAIHIRGWFAETLLPEVFKVMRQQRLVFLLDDAETLTDGMRAGRLLDDSFTYLHSLTQQHSTLGFVLTLDSFYEGEIPFLSPLIGLTDVFRLDNLSETETALLLRKPVEGRYSINDEAVKAVYRTTGGQPRLLQRFGARLIYTWEAHSENSTLTTADVKAVTPEVYRQSESDFQRTWEGLGRNERLTLRAMSQLHYADPLTPPDVAKIEGWLIESDNPLDMTAIRTALRALEYHEIIEQVPGGSQITAGLMQSWLLEHAHLKDARSAVLVRRPRLWWAAAAVLILLAALLILIVSQRRDAVTQPDALPTVVLVGTP